MCVGGGVDVCWWWCGCVLVVWMCVDGVDGCVLVLWMCWRLCYEGYDKMFWWM